MNNSANVYNSPSTAAVVTPRAIIFEDKEQVAEMVEFKGNNHSSSDVTEQKPVGDSWPAGSEPYQDGNDDRKTKWTARTAIAALSLCGLYTSSQLLLYFTGGILGFIVSDIGGANVLGWIPTSHLIALSAVSPFVGYLEDIFGRRWIGIAGLVSLCGGCVLMATTHSFAQAVLGMTFSGAGAAIGELTALAGIAEIVPVRRRAVAIACITLGMIPWQPFVLYGQLLATNHGWRSAIWLVFAFTTLVLVGFSASYFPRSQPDAEEHSKRAVFTQLDFVGGLLSITGITILLVALQAGGYTHPWHSAYVLAQLVLGVVLVIAFVIWEYRGPKNAMVPAILFQGQHVVALVYVVAFVAGMNFFSFLNLFPINLQALYQPGPVKLGLYSLGFSLGVGIGVNLGDALLGCVEGQVRLVLTAAAILMTAFLGALAACNPLNPDTTTVLGTFAGLGCGGILTPAATVALIVVPDAYLATAAALSLAVRGIGGAIGYAIYSSILKSKLLSKLPLYVAEHAIQAGLPTEDVSIFVKTFLTVPANATELPGVTGAIVEAASLGSRWAYADSLKYVWLSTIAFGVLAIACSAMVPSVRKWETDRVRTQM